MLAVSCTLIYATLTRCWLSSVAVVLITPGKKLKLDHFPKLHSLSPPSLCDRQGVRISWADFFPTSFLLYVEILIDNTVFVLHLCHVALIWFMHWFTEEDYAALFSGRRIFFFSLRVSSKPPAWLRVGGINPLRGPQFCDFLPLPFCSPFKGLAVHQIRHDSRRSQ